MNDPVKNPSHYTSGDVECKVAMQSMMDGADVTPYQAKQWGTVFEYLWRWPRKDGMRDLKKAQEVLGDLIARVEQ